MDPVTKDDHAFLELLIPITKDLVNHGYEPSDDGEDDTTVDGYHVMFTHCDFNTPTLYVCRDSGCAVLITACDFEQKDIRISALGEWERWGELMTKERGLPLEASSLQF